MPRVRIDTRKLGTTLTGALPSKADTDRLRKGVGAAAMANWKRLAQQELKSTARDYIAGIQMIEGENSTIIELTGRVPNMVEKGWEGGDMRQWLLNGPNAKMGKNGPYNTVPFRHGAPGSSGKNTGRPMPRSIHAVAKHLSATVTRPEGGKTNWGARLHPGMPLKKQARKILESKEKPWHATSIYNGMVRQEKTYERSTQSKYTTFRRISMHSSEPGKHWVHPGIQPRNLAKRTNDDMGRIIGRLVATSMGKKP